MKQEEENGTALNPVEIKSNVNCLTRERVDALANKIDEELPSGNQNVWDLPDGYQFTDENGNVINATKIFLEKKKKEYPKTYEECLEILGYNIAHTIPMNHGHNGLLMMRLQRLLICRDAYWKIAGEEMGLDEPWKPDYNEESYEQGCPIKYVIYYTGTHITKGQKCTPSYILSFPTAEMRDAFKENFKELIESVKELL